MCFYVYPGITPLMKNKYEGNTITDKVKKISRILISDKDDPLNGNNKFKRIEYGQSIRKADGYEIFFDTKMDDKDILTMTEYIAVIVAHNSNIKSQNQAYLDEYSWMYRRKFYD